MTKVELGGLTTEGRNLRSLRLDELSPSDIARLMSEEEQIVPLRVAEAADSIGAVVDVIVRNWPQGGRIIYVGAGTSGRLGLLDAVECPPTFGVEPDRVRGILAGGYEAFFRAKEGKEDEYDGAEEQLAALNLTPYDCVVGVSASGRTPFVLGALAYAKNLGATTACVVCHENSPIAESADYPIVVVVGPEVVTGSTRLKAGTATKMVLNQITTATFVALGYCFQNLMVGVKPSCAKLVDRAQRIIQEVLGCSSEDAEGFLNEAAQDVRVALVMATQGWTQEEAARQVLERGRHWRVLLDKEGSCGVL